MKAALKLRQHHQGKKIKQQQGGEDYADQYGDAQFFAA